MAVIRSVQVEEPEAPKAPEVPKAQKGLRAGPAQSFRCSNVVKPQSTQRYTKAVNV